MTAATHETPATPDGGEGVSRELGRIRTRWPQLLLERAESLAPQVLAHAQEVVDATPGEPATLPDLGPAVVVDQLTVVVHDALAAGAPGADDLEQRLRDVRRLLA